MYCECRPVCSGLCDYVLIFFFSYSKFWSDSDHSIHQLSTAPGEKVKVEVTQSRQTLRPQDCCLPGSSVHGILHARVGCQSLLQGIFLTQGSSPFLPNFRQILYHLRMPQVLIPVEGTKIRLLGKELPGSFQPLVTGTSAHFWVLFVD